MIIKNVFFKALFTLISPCVFLDPSWLHAQEKNLSYPIKIQTTVGMIADVVNNIGGSQVMVKAMMGPGVDPHTYKASPGDVNSLLNADLIFYQGLHLEGRMAEVFEKVSKRKIAIAVGEKLDPKLLLRPPQFEGHYDPHIWMDVSLWTLVAETVKDELVKFDPAHKTDYEAKWKVYKELLTQLHHYVKQVISSVPRERRVIVTAHDAFSYFGRAYDIEVRGIQGISTESEAGLKDINDLVDFLVTKKIGAVFVESSVPRKNVEALIEGCLSRGHQVNIGGELFSDAMGGAGTPEGTYTGMILHNAHVITSALGGTIPEGDFEVYRKKHADR